MQWAGCRSTNTRLSTYGLFPSLGSGRIFFVFVQVHNNVIFTGNNNNVIFTFYSTILFYLWTSTILVLLLLLSLIFRLDPN
jgi:hypothetical protein